MPPILNLSEGCNRWNSKNTLNKSNIYNNIYILKIINKYSYRCETLVINGTRYCEWEYNGLGMEYQILAGPSYIAVYTILGVILGFAADKFNRLINFFFSYHYLQKNFIIFVKILRKCRNE